MFASLEPSLNAVEERLRDSVRRGRWKKLFGSRPPSADTIGYAFSRFDLDSLREMIHHLYTVLQRNHHVARLRVGGLRELVVDGHELSSSYLRSCPQCARRTVHTRGGDRIQFYHRVVVATLASGKIALPLDAEPILPGEDEIAASLRLLERLHLRYPKLYDVLAGDGLYADPRVLEHVRAHGKHLLAVLKENHPGLLGDARALCEVEQPVTFAAGQTHYEQWDIEGFSSWWQVDEQVRVVRSRETGKRAGEINVSDWLWVTTTSRKDASTETVCKMGHSRWEIENDCFNYMGRFLHIDHCFHHNPTAILAFLLVAFIAYILLQAFYHFNLKPERRRISMRAIIAEIALTFWASLSHAEKPP
jgi:hypothetical protein